VRKPADEISVKKDESLEVLLEIRDLLKEIRSTKKKN
jgi:hypothetical protein